MIGYGIAIGLVVGLVAGAVLVRYGMGLAGRLIYATKENLPLLHAEHAAPLEQANTDGTQDIDLEA
jgi:hypothetical protein